MLYPVVLSASETIPPLVTRKVSCAMLLDVQHRADRQSLRLGVVAFAYIDFSASAGPHGDAACRPPVVAVAIESPNTDGTYPEYVAVDSSATLRPELLVDSGRALLVCCSPAALLGGSLFQSLLASTAGDTAINSTAGICHMGHGPDSQRGCSSYLMVWRDQRSMPVSPATPELAALPTGRDADSLILSGALSAVLGCWGGHLHSLGLSAPFAMQVHAGGPRLEFSTALAGTASYHYQLESRAAAAQMVPNYIGGRHSPSSVSNVLFVDPCDESGPVGPSLSATLLDSARSLLIRMADLQMRVPVVGSGVSSREEVPSAVSTAIYNRDAGLFSDDPTLPAGVPAAVGIYPLSSLYALRDSGCARRATYQLSDLSEQLRTMFPVLGSRNPFVTSASQAGPSASPLLGGVYGHLTSPSRVVAEMLVAVTLQYAWYGTDAPAAVTLPSAAHLSDLSTVLCDVVTNIPGTLLHPSQQHNGWAQVCTPLKVARTMQAIAATLAALHTVGTLLNFDPEPSRADSSSVADRLLSEIDSVIDAPPYAIASGLVGPYRDKLCNWLQSALMPQAGSYIYSCRHYFAPRLALISLVANGLAGTAPTATAAPAATAPEPTTPTGRMVPRSLLESLPSLRAMQGWSHSEAGPYRVDDDGRILPSPRPSAFRLPDFRGELRDERVFVTMGSGNVPSNGSVPARLSMRPYLQRAVEQAAVEVLGDEQMAAPVSLGAMAGSTTAVLSTSLGNAPSVIESEMALSGGVRVEVRVPITLSITTSVSAAQVYAVSGQGVQAQEALAACIASAVEELIVARLGTPSSSSKPAAKTSDSLAPTVTKKRRLIIPDGGNKS